MGTAAALGVVAASAPAVAAVVGKLEAAAAAAAGTGIPAAAAAAAPEVAVAAVAAAGGTKGEWEAGQAAQSKRASWGCSDVGLPLPQATTRTTKY